MKLIFRLWTILLLVSLCPAAGVCQTAPAVVLAKERKSEYRFIVSRVPASEAELSALYEFRSYLGRITEAAAYLSPWYKPVPEGFEPQADRCIYIGWTDYAKANGLDGSKMGSEEWAIKTVGSNLILTGGRPRGTLYAVYHFLEDQCGVHWFDRDTEVVPYKPDLSIPPLDLRDKPRAWFRGIYKAADQLPESILVNERQFIVRNRCPQMMFNPYWEDVILSDGMTSQFRWWMWLNRRDGGFEFNHGYGHSFYDYVPTSSWYPSNPEYYGLSRENPPKTPPDSLNGALCLTNAEVRDRTVTQLKAWIHEDRAAALSFGYQPPRFYDLSHLDEGHPCPCANCRAFVRKYGEESDLLIDFVNYAADSIKDEYPDILIKTFAYTWDITPPKQIRPHDNVLVQWCDWGGAPDGNPNPDQTLHDPVNKWRLSSLKAWSSITKHFGIWDYGFSPFHDDGVSIPVAITNYTISDFKFFGELKAEMLFLENEERAVRVPWLYENFYFMRLWLAYKLMEDPAQDSERLMNTFFTGYYGAAAGKIREFHDYLNKNQALPREPRQLADRSATLSYLTPEFYITIQKIFDAAETVSTLSVVERQHVQQERLRVDRSMLELWGDLERQLPDGESLPYDHTAVINRLESEGRDVIEGRPWADKQAMTKSLDDMITYQRNPNLPEFVSSMNRREYCDIAWKTEYAGESAWASQPLEFYVGDAKLILSSSDFPKDGKYHLYKVGRTRLHNRSQFLHIKAGGGKTLGGFDLHTRINDKDSVADWDIYVSVRLVGPSFAPDSGEKDTISTERILLVRAVPGANRPAEEKSAMDELHKQRELLPIAQAATKTLDLPIKWQFREDPKNEGEAAKWFDKSTGPGWTDIQVDKSWTEQGHNYHGIGWYNVTFKAPKLPANNRALLLFGAVDGQCWIWLDGKLAGTQLVTPEIMWNQPFAIDLGNTVKSGKIHHIVVKVSKDYNAAGIWRPVELRIAK